MTRELDELHHDVGMPAMWEGVSSMIDNLRDAPVVRSTNRRTFLMGAGAAVAGSAALLSVGLNPLHAVSDHSEALAKVSPSSSRLSPGRFEG